MVRDSVTPVVELAPQRERGLSLRSPLIAGPGSAGYGRETSKILPVERLGALITTTTTLHHRTGSRQPRLIESPAGLLMSTGLPNPGLRTALQRNARFWERLKTPVILSLAADNPPAFAYAAQTIEEADVVAGLELEPDLLAADTDMVRVVDKLRNVTGLPLLAHVPVGSPRAVADAIIDLAAVGCDAVLLGSPWPGMAIDSASRKPLLAAGLLGPAIRPLALRLVYDVCQLLGPEHIPLLGAGGISSPADVAAMLAAGAAAAVLDSVLFVDPAAVAAMVEEVSGRL